MLKLILALTLLFNASAMATSIDDGSPLPVRLESTQFEIFLGFHKIEYFADRMVLKSKRAGYNFARKKQLKDNSFLVILGPFNSKEEAKIAEDKIKLLTPDLTMSQIREVKK